MNDANYPMSGRIFDAWNWRIKDEKSANDLMTSVSREAMFEVNREKIYGMMENRTTSEKGFLYARRTLLILINLSVQLGGWYLIILVQDASQTIVISS